MATMMQADGTMVAFDRVRPMRGRLTKAQRDARSRAGQRCACGAHPDGEVLHLMSGLAIVTRDPNHPGVSWSHVCADCGGRIYRRKAPEE